MRHIALSFQVAITLQVYVTFAVPVRSGKRYRESTATGRAFYYTGEPVRTYTGYELGEYMAYEYKFVGRNGAKGEKREKRRKATPEQMARQNQWTRQKKMTYTIRANFKSGDSWITLKYPRGTKPDPEMMKKHWKSFSDKLREYYKKNGHVLKFILRMEIGKNGGPHMHLLVNHIDNIDQVIK